MKKIKKIFIFVLLALALITTSSCQNVEKDPSEFDAFSKEILDLIIGDNEMVINFMFNNPEDFDIAHGTPYLSVPSESSSAFGVILLNVILGEVDMYDYNKLSFDQQMTYNIIKDLMEDINNKVEDEAFMGRSYLGSYLGYQAQLPLQMLNYKLRNITDVENYFVYLDQMDETFKSYVDFEIKAADKGYGMPDFVIDNVVGQCENFLKNIDDDSHYMIKTMNDKISKLAFLTNEEIIKYQNINKEKVRGPMADAYRYVMENLPKLKGKATNNMGLAHYTNKDGVQIGKQYYEKVFQDSTGYNVTVDEALVYVEEKLEESYSNILGFKDYFSNNPNEYEALQQIVFMDLGIEEQLNMFKNIIDGYYPAIHSDYTLNINYVDESLQDYYSPAAYFISPIDDRKEENIFLNPADIYLPDGSLDQEYLFTALAHEGIPGHMYQNIYFKTSDANLLRKVLKDSGYQEGWANYSETFVTEYFFDHHPEYSNEIRNYYLETIKFQAAFYTKLDIGIHYLGWTLEETASYLDEYYNIDLETSKRVYNQLVEIPGNYPTYFYTYLKIMDLREYMLNSGASLLDFHTLMLDAGPVPLRFIEEYIKTKYKDQLAS